MVNGVEVVNWNPRRSFVLGRTGLSLPRRQRVKNFGDVLSPVIVEQMLTRFGWTESAPRASRLLAVGSIMHFSRDGDTVWGSGVNGKVPIGEIRSRNLSVRAVRGPRTAEVLSALGISIREVYGDPALLAPSLLALSRSSEQVYPVTCIPNLNDAKAWRSMPGFVDPRGHYRDVIQRIAASEIVVSSSLHGLVIADALGVPASWMVSKSEPNFKYLDYLEGTGRSGEHPNTTLSRAFDNPLPSLKWDQEPLVRSFPIDIWKK